MSFSRVSRKMAAALVFWSLGTMSAPAQTDVPPYAWFFSVSDPVEGRVHVVMQLTTPDDATFLRIRDVVEGTIGVDILLEFEVIDEVTGPEVQVRNQPLTIDQLPAGSYPLRIINVNDPGAVVDQVAIEVPEQIGFRHPLPLAVWPPEPGLLDDVWLLLEPPGLCDSLALQAFAPTAERVFLMRSPDPCPVDGPEPRLAAINLGRSPPQDALKQLFAPTTDAITEDDLVGAFRFSVTDRLSDGIAGRWTSELRESDSIEMRVDSDGRLELFWQTLSRRAGPVRIEAEGAGDGLVATFDATILVRERVPAESGGIAVVRKPWGSVAIEFTNCDLAVMSWETDFPGFGSSATVIRKTNPGGNIGCASSPPESELVPSWYQGPGTFYRLPADARAPD